MTSTQTTNLTAGMGDQISESQPKDPNLTTCDGNMRGSESRGCLGTIWAHVFREPCHEERRRKKEYVRSSWIGRVDCTTSLIGAVVGLGNLTRFPQLAFKYGSGTFLWPFILVTILLGVPMFYLEACLGQLSGKGGVLGWDIVPLFKGVGVSIALTCGVLSVYYSSMCMYPFYYFVSSWMSPLPWRHCDNPWNTNACILIETCHGHGSVKAHFRNGTCISNGNGSTLSFSTGSGYVFSSEEYWKEKVEGDGGVGPLQSHLVGCLLVVWFLCFVALGRDVLYLGKVMIFSVLVLFMVLVVLVVNGFLLPNQGEGLIYFLTPKSNVWKEPRLWYDASAEAFFGSALATGVIATMTSYSRYSDGSPLKLSMLVVMVDLMTTIVGGFVFFTRAGYLAHEMDVSVESFERFEGDQVTYILYPLSMMNTKVAPSLSIMFFVALFGVGITTQIGFVNVLTTMLLDLFPKLAMRRYLTLLVFSLVGFLLALPFTLKGANKFASLMLANYGPFCMLLNCLLEVLVVAWIYGLESFCSEVQDMIQKKPPAYFRFCWKYVIPVYLLVLLCWTVVRELQDLSTGKQIVWVLAFLPFLCMLITTGYLLWRAPESSFMQKLKTLLVPDPYWARKPESSDLSFDEHRHAALADCDNRLVLPRRDAPDALESHCIGTSRPLSPVTPRATSKILRESYRHLRTGAWVKNEDHFPGLVGATDPTQGHVLAEAVSSNSSSPCSSSSSSSSAGKEDATLKDASREDRSRKQPPENS